MTKDSVAGLVGSCLVFLVCTYIEPSAWSQDTERPARVGDDDDVTSPDGQVNFREPHLAEALRATYSDVVLRELDATIREALRDTGVTVVFPVLHGPPGEDGTFQGFLEILGLPYVTPTSLYPDAARAGGLSFEALVAFLIERALSRAGAA